MISVSKRYGGFQQAVNRLSSRSGRSQRLGQSREYDMLKHFRCGFGQRFFRARFFPQFSSGIWGLADNEAKDQPAVPSEQRKLTIPRSIVRRSSCACDGRLAYFGAAIDSCPSQCGEHPAWERELAL